MGSYVMVGCEALTIMEGGVLWKCPQKTSAIWSKDPLEHLPSLYSTLLPPSECSNRNQILHQDDRPSHWNSAAVSERSCGLRRVMRSSRLLCAGLWRSIVPRTGSGLFTQSGLDGTFLRNLTKEARYQTIARRASSGFVQLRLPCDGSGRPFQQPSQIFPTRHPFSGAGRWSIVRPRRELSTTKSLEEARPTAVKEKEPNKLQIEEDGDKDGERGFARTEKASQAAQVNLSARLAKDGKSQGQTAGFGEVWRLIKIAKPEAKVLGVAFVLLLISSSITMSIPFSIGKILDIATKSEPGSDQLFGLDLTTFYMALAGVITVGAAANYGRIIILRIVGERIVARLRSQLFRRTFTQNAEFFDANRVGDLISRLSSDTIIVGKSITQNLSDGLRALVSGGAGFGLMAYVSLKLTGILTLMFPPVAIGAFFYGKAIRNLSRKIQRNLGTLTKIAEERLGNVRTSQAFAGEILEVARYNKQTKKIFELGKREALISATFFSTVCSKSFEALCTG